RDERSTSIARRAFLQQSSLGFGWLAFTSLLAERAQALSAPRFAPRAKSVIFLFMDGGVSHVDTFDPKPALEKHAGEPFIGDTKRKWVPSPWKFAQHGRSGMWVSELFPHVAGCADETAVIRSMKAELPIHSTGVI